MPQFIQLTSEDCQYLLELINDMDLETPYTEKQRSYTIPKLQKIQQDPYSARLAFQDVQYLLELIEDDVITDTSLEDLQYLQDSVKTTLLKIQSLQLTRYTEAQNIELQRQKRRARRVTTSSVE